MKKYLITTLADDHYLQQAKQLFSSVYFNAGWKGDYLLLAHNISEANLSWFRKRGILIKKCRPLFEEEYGKYPPVLTSKMYLFIKDIKRWKRVVYLDSDIIVRASLDGLLKIKGYAAATDIDNKKLLNQFIHPPKNNSKLIQEISKITSFRYDLSELSFNAGMFTYDTKLIKDKTFETLVSLLKICKHQSRYGDQLVQNLYFYRTWRKLPAVYNLNPEYYAGICGIKTSNLRGIVLHFNSIGKIYKPWYPKNYFYSEWINNLNKADQINNVNKILSPKIWSNAKIIIYEIYLRWRHLFNYRKHLTSLRQKINKNTV